MKTLDTLYFVCSKYRGQRINLIDGIQDSQRQKVSKLLLPLQFFALNHRLFSSHTGKSRPGSAKSRNGDGRPAEGEDEQNGEAVCFYPFKAVQKGLAVFCVKS